MANHRNHPRLAWASHPSPKHNSGAFALSLLPMHSHHTSDKQSLLLTQAALAGLRAHPERLQAVMSTLDHWDLVAPADSQALRNQWRSLLRSGNWHLALEASPAGQQLRQASPLGRALNPQQRLNIIRACKGRNSNI